MVGQQALALSVGVRILLSQPLSGLHPKSHCIERFSVD